MRTCAPRSRADQLKPEQEIIDAEFQRLVDVVCFHEAILLSRSGLNASLDWQTRFDKILAFKTAKVAGISQLI
jgi:hypothetical protein